MSLGKNTSVHIYYSIWLQYTLSILIESPLNPLLELPRYKHSKQQMQVKTRSGGQQPRCGKHIQ